MDIFELLDTPASLRDTSVPDKCYNGRTIFYIDEENKILYLHFETSFDQVLMHQLLSDPSAAEDYFLVNAKIQSQFAQVFLFAASVCHIIILTETGTSFDSSHLAMFRALSSIREKCFLNYANKSAAGKRLFSHLGKEMRLCAPKMIFVFEKPPEMDEPTVEQYRQDMEQDIYSTFKSENLLSKNTCLFVLHKKLAFVHVNRKDKSTIDPVQDAMQHLMTVLNNYSQGMKNNEIVEPFVGFGRPFSYYPKELIDSEVETAKQANQQRKHSIRRVIRKHVKDILAASAVQGGENEGSNKSRATNSHRVNIPSGKFWLEEIFEAFHELIFGQVGDVDPEYVSEFVLKIISLSSTQIILFPLTHHSSHWWFLNTTDPSRTSSPKRPFALPRAVQ